MKPLQKVIKYLSIAFAIFLIVNIFSAILFGIHIFADVLCLNSKTTNNFQMSIIDFENTDIATLNIKTEYSNLIIKNGDTLKAESNSNQISCTQNNNQILIKEENKNWFSKDSKNQVIIYIPSNIIFDNIFIETGAGDIEIESISTKDLSLKMGAGKVEIKNINVLNKAKIEGGVGNVNILDGEINNLDLDIGIGKFTITTKLIGNNKINAGIGSLTINLKDNLENYCIYVNKGIGSININGTSVPDDAKYGNGSNSVKVDGGIGSISIKKASL